MGQAPPWPGLVFASLLFRAGRRRARGLQAREAIRNSRDDGRVRVVHGADRRAHVSVAVARGRGRARVVRSARRGAPAHGALPRPVRRLGQVARGRDVDDVVRAAAPNVSGRFASSPRRRRQSSRMSTSSPRPVATAAPPRPVAAALSNVLAQVLRLRANGLPLVRPRLGGRRQEEDRVSALITLGGCKRPGICRTTPFLVRSRVRCRRTKWDHYNNRSH